jgi:hypothetical protein
MDGNMMKNNTVSANLVFTSTFHKRAEQYSGAFANFVGLYEMSRAILPAMKRRATKAQLSFSCLRLYVARCSP